MGILYRREKHVSRVCQESALPVEKDTKSLKNKGFYKKGFWGVRKARLGRLGMRNH
jgi:hypothetical protein